MIHVAAGYGSFALVEALLAHDADPTRTDAHFTSVLFRAEHNRTEDKARILELLERELAKQPWPAEAEQIDLVTEGYSPGHLWSAEPRVRNVRGKVSAQGSLWVSGNDVALAFDVVWIAGDREWRVGSLAADPGSVRAFEYESAFEGDPPAEVVIELRPSRAVALRDLKTWKIWGEPIALGGVKVD